MTNKEKVKQVFPFAYCARNKGKYLIWDDGSNPCYKGHKSSAKAWADLWESISKLDKKNLDKIKKFYNGRV